MPPRPQLHLKFEIDGQSFVYCHIRKNACSAFKRLIRFVSPDLHEDSKDFEEMRVKHGTRSIRQTRAADHRIMVYRDPVQRSASLFCNKFIARSGAGKISSSYQSATGQLTKDASFTDFVMDYLGNDLCQIDRHAWPQRLHLQPVVYKDAIPLRDLHARMSELIGPALADRFFAKPVNTSSSADLGPVSTVPSKELREHFIASGELPAAKNLLTPELQRRLRVIYRSDKAFFDKA